MKKHIRIFASLAALALAMPMLTSCEGDQAVPPMPLPEGLYNEEGEIGKGTWEEPLTAYQARIGTKPTGMTDNVWVTGYIVGWVNSDLGAVLSEKTAMFTGSASVKSNVLISDYTPEELVEKFVKKDDKGDVVEDTRWEHVTPVEAIYGTDSRSLNLGDNPSNYKKRVAVYGETGVKKYGVFGVKFTQAYNLGKNIGFPIPPKVPGTFEKANLFVLNQWYLIGHDGRVAQNFRTDRSYLKIPEDMNDNGDVIKLANKNKFAFYFEDAGLGKVRIKEANGLYLCISENDPALHTTEDYESSDCLFSVQSSGESGMFKITANNGSQLMYDSEYGSFGIYRSITAKYSLPTLYIEVK